MKFLGMVTMMALVSTVAFADDHATADHSADAVQKSAQEVKAAAKKMEHATATGTKDVAKAGRKGAKKAEKAAAKVQGEQTEATEEAAKDAAKK